MRNTPHVFGWEEEPADERPSEFMSSSGYSVLSGYHVPRDLSARHARRRRGSGVGFGMVLLAFVVLVVSSGVVIHEVVKLLR